MHFLPLTSEAGDAISPQAEDIPSRAVILHDRHIICEGCAREWLASANTCPECRKVLFELKEEESTNEPTVYVDSVNLRDSSNAPDLQGLLQEFGPGFLDQNAHALAYFTRPLIRQLRERTTAYEALNLFLDFEYPGYDALFRPGTVVNEEAQRQACVINQHAVVDFWAWWAKRFFVTLANAEFDLRHHPLAVSLLFQMLHAMKILPDNFPITRALLSRFLAQRLMTFAKDRVGSIQAQEFDGYVVDMVEAALSATAGRMHVPASEPHEERKTIYETLYK
ncbi:uncharacterized protein MYCFIDRAFT_195344 [Pseudocercospora fijiensis CIRAD86]|uniref:RING-type domain-containing protein n=1 Tax=Pseudocercospora fijiensis (strain CIRAD86) TaxID=383855 RepID=M2Z317_PSEFD|nr:uncharacterized protein MYCFIDRAFT_195344 [Pseudocercospora fijiensis CIRAD86]EME84230.1 hypothetical protein MYCFIDRAFT_195344 [Pseudocercospora fijiensis CIRAD86]